MTSCNSKWGYDIISHQAYVQQTQQDIQHYLTIMPVGYPIETHHHPTRVPITTTASSQQGTQYHQTYHASRVPHITIPSCQQGTQHHLTIMPIRYSTSPYHHPHRVPNITLPSCHQDTQYKHTIIPAGYPRPPQHPCSRVPSIPTPSMPLGYTTSPYHHLQ